MHCIYAVHVICPIKYVTFPHKCVQKVHINVYSFCTHFFVHIYVDECYVHISVYKSVDVLYTIVARVYRNRYTLLS